MASTRERERMINIWPQQQTLAKWHITWLQQTPTLEYKSNTHNHTQTHTSTHKHTQTCQQLTPCALSLHPKQTQLCDPLCPCKSSTWLQLHSHTSTNDTMSPLPNYTHTHTHTYIHTHTYTHTHIHTHTHTQHVHRCDPPCPCKTSTSWPAACDCLRPTWMSSRERTLWFTSEFGRYVLSFMSSRASSPRPTFDIARAQTLLPAIDTVVACI